MGVPPSNAPGHGSAEPLWRAVAAFRFAGLGYAVLLAILNRAHYSRLDWAWVVIAAMTAWTVVTTVAYAHPERRTPALLGTDLAVTAGLLRHPRPGRPGPPRGPSATGPPRRDERRRVGNLTRRVAT